MSLTKKQYDNLNLAISMPRGRTWTFDSNSREPCCLLGWLAALEGCDSKTLQSNSTSKVIQFLKGKGYKRNFLVELYQENDYGYTESELAEFVDAEYQK